MLAIAEPQQKVFVSESFLKVKSQIYFHVCFCFLFFFYFVILVKMAKALNPLVLERKIDRRMKEYTDEMKLFKSELQLIKNDSKTKRPSSEAKLKETLKVKQAEAANKTLRKLKSIEKKSVSGRTDPKMSKRAVNSPSIKHLFVSCLTFFSF